MLCFRWFSILWSYYYGMWLLKKINYILEIRKKLRFLGENNFFSETSISIYSKSGLAIFFISPSTTWPKFKKKYEFQQKFRKCCSILQNIFFKKTHLTFWRNTFSSNERKRENDERSDNPLQLNSVYSPNKYCRIIYPEHVKIQKNRFYVIFRWSILLIFRNSLHNYLFSTINIWN